MRDDGTVTPGGRSPLAAALAGAAATATGIGLARFGYVPLFPAMVAAGWVGGGEAGLLGAVNFAGYLAGALLGPWAGRRLGVRGALDAGMALAVAAFLACALDGGFPWLAAWRGLAGLAGGVLMALAGPAVQAATPAERRGRASGLVIAGVGAGVVAASLLVPVLLGVGGVAGAWLGLGLVAAALWAFARPRWPAPAAVPAAGTAASTARTGRLMLAYTLSAAGMAAPMVYLSDLAARGHGMGVAAGGLVWTLFGLGALAGTLLGGRAADRLGGDRALALWLAVQVAALALAVVPHAAAVPAAALLSGFSGVGVSAVALAALRSRAGTAAGRLWSRATSLYALAQAVAGTGLAWLFARAAEVHAPVFWVGLGFSAAGLMVAVAPGRRAPARS